MKEFKSFKTTVYIEDGEIVIDSPFDDKKVIKFRSRWVSLDEKWGEDKY